MRRLYERSDTIVAPATPAGMGGVSVVRLSGPLALPILREAFHCRARLASHMMRLGRLMDGESLVDECMAVYMAAPRTYTGEDVTELHLHGSPVAVQRALRLCCRLGARLAEPGEFTLRAFVNGKMGLSQAEAVMDVVAARSLQEHDMALSRLTGALQTRVAAMQGALLGQIAAIEACVDFPEEDVEERTGGQVAAEACALAQSLRALIQDGEAAAAATAELRVAIAGLPNVGKSSLMNALCGQDRSIVSEQPGTTRDVVSAQVPLRGLIVLFQDTAGLRDAPDDIERQGVERADAARALAEAHLLVLDATRPLSPAERALLQTPDGRRIAVVNKCDRPLHADLPGNPLLAGALRVSARTGEGLPALKEALHSLLADASGAPAAALMTSQRHLRAARVALAALQDALSALTARPPLPLDCACVDLRAAWSALGDITGDAAPDRLIEEIFSRFCVGK